MSADNNYSHDVLSDMWTTPQVPIDPTKDFHGRVLDVIDYLRVEKLGAEDQGVYIYGGHLMPSAVPESDPVLMQRRHEVLSYMVRDLGESLIETGARNSYSFDRWMIPHLHRTLWRYEHLRFALLFQNPRRSIRRFPSEILLLIFEWAVDGRDDVDNFYYNTVVASIASTCRLWRTLIEKHKRFWTRISFHPRARPFFPYQLKILVSLNRHSDPLHVDINLHKKNRETPLVSTAAEQKVERFKKLVTELAAGLAAELPGMAPPFSRCARLRIWANVLEWKALGEAVRLLRRCVAPGLRELQIDVIDSVRALPALPPDRWIPYLGSTMLRVLRLRCVTNLWDWPSSVPQAAPLAQLVHLEMHTLGVAGPRLHHFHAILLAATNLQSLRLWSCTIRNDGETYDPITLPALRELAFSRVEIASLQAFLSMIRTPNLDRTEFGDLVYDSTKADFFSAGMLLQCSQLDDLRIRNITFNAPIDFPHLLQRLPRLRNFMLCDVNPQAVNSARKCLLDVTVTPQLKHFQFAYAPPHVEEYVNDGRIEAFDSLYYILGEQRPSLDVRNVFDNYFLQFGRAFTDYTVKMAFDDE